MTGPPTVLGADPGGSWCGLVVRRGDELLAHTVLERRTHTSLQDWCDQALEAAELLHGHVDLYAVELTVGPSGHAKGRDGHIIDPAPLIDCAQVGGALFGQGRTRAAGRVWVPPGGHGQVDIPAGAGRGMGHKILRATFPHDLVPDNVWRGTSDPLRHCRSAWDIAGAGRRIHRALEAVS